MNTDAKNITAAIRVIDNKVAYEIKEYIRTELTDKWPVNNGYLLKQDFKLYSSAIVDYCRLKYNDEVAEFLNRYIDGRAEYLSETFSKMKKEFLVNHAKEKLKSILTNSPGTADVLNESATGEEIINLVNLYVAAKDSFMFTDGSTCINIFYAELNKLCAKYNCTHSI